MRLVGFDCDRLVFVGDVWHCLTLWLVVGGCRWRASLIVDAVVCCCLLMIGLLCCWVCSIGWYFSASMLVTWGWSSSGTVARGDLTVLMKKLKKIKNLI